ncbi:TERF1-interacting nuclear factor 2 [Anarrhichthys ocellatus]|uniref:TERF1-interacting nuclear factor 2 n=1 Tax=Anarrhichthys ocellatus TaxID=433405 RepID=UPI0012EED94E|nr:TERF1-interacting nuclear factor 2 [Anarrhichthys ocellatus]
MATRKHKENDVSLPFAALQLLAPPVRLVSAALWKVMKQRDVMQYGVVEEVVTSACETVPGLLTVRHQGKLALGLRGRLILELCCTQPDEKVIMPHLQRMCAPAALSSSSALAMRRDVKILRTVENFHSLVHTLLKNPTDRELFFKEEFPVDYGPKYDQELEKLLWEFLIRLDQLLPVPSLAQTVAWLSNAPAVLEECARAATQPQLLKILLQHQTCLGHLEVAASLPPNMGDSILSSLSLPPSGRIPSNPPTGAQTSGVDQSHGTQTRDKTAFITPVIRLISNEDVPVMIRTKKATNEHFHPKENLKYTAVKERHKPKDGEEQVEGERTALKRSSGMKRKQPDEVQGESDEEEEVFGPSSSGKNRISRSLRNGASMLKRDEGDQKTNESEGDGAVGNEECNGAALETCMTQLGIKTLHLPEDPFLCSIFVSCLRSQPRVIVEKMTPASANGAAGGGNSSGTKRETPRRKSPVKAEAQIHSQPLKPDSDDPGLDDKENLPVLPSISSSPSLLRRNTVMSGLPGDADDYVADSEDEVTKNFKVRLFMKRYCKTKHGTYVPTLREYWKPGMTRRNLTSAGSKRR